MKNRKVYKLISAVSALLLLVSCASQGVGSESSALSQNENQSIVSSEISKREASSQPSVSSEPSKDETSNITSEKETNSNSTSSIITESEEIKDNQATIKKNFVEDEIIVTFKKSFNWELRPITVEDFPELELKEIKEPESGLEELAKEVRQAMSKDDGGEALRALAEASEVGHTVESLTQIGENYNQWRVLVLKNKGKQNVLDAIKELKKRDEILYAEPNYISYLID